ncbi:MAG: thioredoxin fold domain-containing protein [Rubricoccaceae bacterium]|nr:thioredoxin fold domain-containing protein [Rubricoccaceae bacterium]
MNRTLTALLGAFLFAAPALAQGGAETGVINRPSGPTAADYPEDSPNWRPMGEAAAAAQADGDLVLIHAYTEWCGWCRRLDQDTYTDDAIQAYLADNYEVTRLDIESPEEIDFFGGTVPMRELGQAFEVSGTPTTVFLDSDGTFITKAPSYWPPDQFLHVLRYVREGFYELMPFDAYVEMAEAETAPEAAPETDPEQGG